MDSTRARLAALPDDELERQLFMLADHIRWPPTPDLKPVWDLNRPIAVRRFERPYLWLAAAIVIVSLGAALALSQGFRDTVAGVFGVRGVDIVILRDDDLTPTVDAPPSLGRLGIGEPVSIQDAVQRIPFERSFPDMLGEPDGWFIRVMPEGNLMLSAVYEPQEELPETAETGVGLLLMQFTSEVDVPFLIKGVAGDTSTIAEVDINAASGYWIEGASQLTILAGSSASWDGSGTRPSANVLLWQADGVTYRMESALSQIDTLEIARSMRAVDDR